MDDATLTRSRNEPGISRGVWVMVLLLAIPVGIIGFLRYRVHEGAQQGARLAPAPVSAIAAPPPASTEITVIAPPPKEPVVESTPAKKKPRRPKAHRAPRAIQDLQRAQLEAAGR